MQIDLLRHGPKNNNPDVHGTGVEALLDPVKIPEIKTHAYGLITDSIDRGYDKIELWSTPIDRARATAEIEYGTMIHDSDEIAIALPRINALIGSSAINPENGEAVNLGSRAMSKIWANAKKLEKYDYLQGENKPLYAWFEQGLDNPQGWQYGKPETWNTEDPGITLREIAWRIGTYLYNVFEKAENQKTRVIAFGHSGDIEPWIALTLQMVNGIDDGFGRIWDEDLTDRFSEIGGALEPLKGARILQLDRSDDLYLFSIKGSDMEFKLGPQIGKEILKRQVRLYHERGMSNKVLAARLEADYKTK